MKRKLKKYTKYITVILFSIVIIYELATGNTINISDIQNSVLNNNNEDYYIEESSSENINKSSFTEAFVNRIVDGDTIEVIIEGKKYKVRFIGVNCPEYTSKIEEYGKEATEYTTSSLLNKTVYLEKDVSETDKYGRLLRYIWFEIPEKTNESEIIQKMFNANLLIDGYAQIATYPPDVKYVDTFKNIQKEAKENNVGLWKK